MDYVIGACFFLCGCSTADVDAGKEKASDFHLHKALSRGARYEGHDERQLSSLS